VRPREFDACEFRLQSGQSAVTHRRVKYFN
jgi:hypothetical protein